MSCENRTLNTRCLPKSICRNPNVVTGTTATTQRFNKAQCLQNKTTNHIATIYHDPMSAKKNNQPQRNGLTKPDICKKRTTNHIATVYHDPMSAKKNSQPQRNGLTKPNVCKKRITATTRWFTKARCLQKKNNQPNRDDLP